MTQSPPTDSVSSTLRLNEPGDKKRPTMNYWAHVTVAILSGDDGALTRGQVANEAILADLRDVDAYEDIEDNLTAVEESVLDDLDRMLDVDVRAELLSLSEYYAVETEARWAHYVRQMFEREQDDDEDVVQHPPHFRKPQCNIYLLPAHTPEGRGLGDLVADSLVQLLASPWDSRAERVADLQAIATAARRGWDAVDDDRMTRFGAWVRDGDTSLYPVGDLADAVDAAINSEDAVEKGVDDEQVDGKIREWDEEETHPERLAELDIAQTVEAQTQVLEAATRYVVRNTSRSFTGPDNISARKDVIRKVLGRCTPHLVETYGPVIKNTEKAMPSTDKADRSGVEAALENLAKSGNDDTASATSGDDDGEKGTDEVFAATPVDSDEDDELLDAGFEN
ncbi:hypothetical protein M0R88_06030 [Halorussus gelatinilyticus]|uniref:Uncharacterized protein n=1 Tax=Halorussus gelatinilyticus TaxID=2937524 RepID=A0A8U0ILU2_9EURY|nr:hypothetical protein [Halorussus gelatinilyticus]UPW01656.1 hypothetical protein M0R88_06030 [Halorussus gelatinilyticus]